MTTSSILTDIIKSKKEKLTEKKVLLRKGIENVEMLLRELNIMIFFHKIQKTVSKSLV